MPSAGVNPVARGVLRNTHASWGGRSTGPPTPLPLSRSRPPPAPIPFARWRSRPPHPATTSVSRRSAPPVKATNIVSGWSRPPLSASDRPAPGSEPPPHAVSPLVCPRPASVEAGAAQRGPGRCRLRPRRGRRACAGPRGAAGHVGDWRRGSSRSFIACRVMRRDASRRSSGVG
jgi:hypothetical protein